METSEISTETVSNMIADSTTMTVVECPHLPQGVGHMCLGSMITDALTVAGEEFQPTLGSRALMRDLFSLKALSTETVLIEKVMTEIYQPAAECMSQVRSASAEPSGLQ